MSRDTEGRKPGSYLVEVPGDWYRLWPGAHAEHGDILAISIDGMGDLTGLDLIRDGQFLDSESDAYPGGDELGALIADACLGRLPKVDAVYSVSVGAAGCLPDSDVYPYFVAGLDAAQDALADELDRDDRAVDIRDELAETLRADGAVSFPLDGTYSLEIAKADLPY